MVVFRFLSVFLFLSFGRISFAQPADFKQVIEESLQRSIQNTQTIEAASYKFLQRHLNKNDLPEYVDQYLRKVLAPVLMGKALNVDLQWKTGDQNVLILESLVKGDGASHRLGRYRIIFDNGPQNEFIIPKLVTTNTSKYDYRRKRELELFNFTVSGDLHVGNVILPGDENKMRGELRGLFRADPLLHPHISNVFKKDDANKKLLSELQEDVVRELLRIEQKQQNENSRKPLASGVLMPVGSGKTVVSALYFKRLHELYQKNLINEPHALKSKMKIVFVVENLRILEDAVRTFSDVYGVPEKEILKMYGGTKLESYPTEFIDKASLWFASRSSFYNAKAEIFEKIKTQSDVSWVLIFDEAHHVGTKEGQIEELLNELKQKEDSLLKAKDRVFYMSATLMHDDTNIISDLDGNLVAPFLDDQEKAVLLLGQGVEAMVQKQIFRGMAAGYMAPLFNYDSLIYQKFSDLPLVLNDIEYDENHKIKYLSYHRNFIRVIYEKIQQVSLSSMGDRGIIFVPTIDHAELYKQEFEKVARKNRDFFEVYHSKISDNEKRRVVNRYRNTYGKRDNRYLIVIDSVNEGVDFPESNLLVNLRINNSFKNLTQNLGRILRVTGFKADARMIDVSHSFIQIVQNAVASGFRYMKDWQGIDRQQIQRYNTVVFQKGPLPPEDFLDETVEFMERLTSLDPLIVIPFAEVPPLSERAPIDEVPPPPVLPVFHKTFNDWDTLLAHPRSVFPDSLVERRNALFQETFEFLSKRQSKDPGNNEKAWQVLLFYFQTEFLNATSSLHSYHSSSQLEIFNLLWSFNQVYLEKMHQMPNPSSSDGDHREFQWTVLSTLLLKYQEAFNAKVKVNNVSEGDRSLCDELLVSLALVARDRIPSGSWEEKLVEDVARLWPLASVKAKKKIIDEHFDRYQKTQFSSQVKDFIFVEGIKASFANAQDKRLFWFLGFVGEMSIFFDGQPKTKLIMLYFMQRYFDYTKDFDHRNYLRIIGDNNVSQSYPTTMVSRVTTQERKAFWEKFKTRLIPDIHLMADSQRPLGYLLLFSKHFLYYFSNPKHYFNTFGLAVREVEDHLKDLDGFHKRLSAELKKQSKEYFYAETEFQRHQIETDINKYHKILIKVIHEHGGPIRAVRPISLGGDTSSSVLETGLPKSQRERDLEDLTRQMEQKINQALVAFFREGYYLDNRGPYVSLSLLLKNLIFENPVALRGLESKVLTLFALLKVGIRDFRFNDSQWHSFYDFVVAAETESGRPEIGYKSWAQTLGIEENYQKYWDIVTNGPRSDQLVPLKGAMLGGGGFWFGLKPTWGRPTAPMDPREFMAPITSDEVMFGFLKNLKSTKLRQKAKLGESEKKIPDQFLQRWLLLKRGGGNPSMETLELLLSHFISYLPEASLADLLKEALDPKSTLFKVKAKDHGDDILVLLTNYALETAKVDRKNLFWFLDPERELDYLFGNYRFPRAIVGYFVVKYMGKGFLKPIEDRGSEISNVSQNKFQKWKTLEEFHQIKASPSEFWRRYEEGPFDGGGKEINRTHRIGFLISYLDRLQTILSENQGGFLDLNISLDTILRELAAIEIKSGSELSSLHAQLVVGGIKLFIETIYPKIQGQEELGEKIWKLPQYLSKLPYRQSSVGLGYNELSLLLKTLAKNTPAPASHPMDGETQDLMSCKGSLDGL